MKNLKSLFSRLGINENNGLYITKDNVWKAELSLPSRVQRLLENELQPDAFFVFDQKPLVLFFDCPADFKNIHRTIWNYNESPVAIIANDYDVEIFNGFNLNKNTELLESFGKSENLDDFSYFKLVTGKTWEQHEKQLSYENRVDYLLLKNIKAAREVIAPGLNNTKSKLANALIGKAIFVRYLIDRHVTLNFGGVSKTWSNNDFCELLSSPNDVRRFFEYLESKDKGFNGDLFRINSTDYDRLTTSDFDVIKKLLSGEDIVKGQRSLFDFYDFSIIPIEFISNVYELFIGQDNQKKEGAYYTPLFLVDYILKETVDKHLNDRKSVGVPKDFTYCRVLDPACGSGIFLVEALRKIIERYKNDTRINVKSDAFKNAIKELAKANIYGIDKDESAVQVAIFSIYLTLLDYLEPKEISDFKFPILLNTNFFHGDFFDLQAAYNGALAKLTFDFIVGNPPWKRGTGEEQPSYVKYINQRKIKESKNGSLKIAIGNKEIAQAFVLRSSDFSTNNTECALIITSKALYNLQSANFRRYLLSNFKLKRIFELAPVRREVFDRSNDKAIAPACILFYNYNQSISLENNIVEHVALKPSRFFSLFKIFTVTRTDFKQIKQQRLIEQDWLWKVLVYGNYLDFNFLIRLKNEFPTIQDYLTNKAQIKQGIKRKDGSKKINISTLKGWDFIDLNKKEIQQFYIAPTSSKWDLEEVGYVYREDGNIHEDMFTPPVLLVKETVNTKLESVAALPRNKAVFTDKITSIKLKREYDSDIYYLIASLFSSELFSYYILHTSSTAGVMIEQQINDIERLSFPYVFDQVIIDEAKLFEKDQHDYYNIKTLTLSDNRAYRKVLLNKAISKAFNLSDIEVALLEYVLNITIPLSMRHPGFEKIFNPLQIRDKSLTAYAEIFLNRFGNTLCPPGKKFIAEIWHTEQIVGILFKVLDLSEQKKQIEWIDLQDDASGILTFLTKISSTKITERLFVQKDIRGFEEDYFYIFKPNEKRLWHKAIAYLDVDEFADAMLKAGRTEI